MQKLLLSSDWDHDWRLTTAGHYTGSADRRGIFSLRHPWAASRTGDFAQLTRRVQVPADWRGPRVLSFMAADTHHGREFIPDEWVYTMDVDIFIDHRFSQVLIDGQVVWEMDVAETDSPIEHLCSLTAHNMKSIGLFWGPGLRRYPSARFGPGVDDPPPYFDIYRCVDLSDKIKPGQAFDLTLRIYDKVGSDQVLPQDVHGITSEQPEDNRAKFDMIAWWADLCLLDEARTAESHFADRIQLAPIAEPRPAILDGGCVDMEIARGETLPAVPFPIWGGVPFPKGALREAERVRLTAAGGDEIPVQARVLSRWPADGSVQWLDVTCVVPPGVRKVTLHYAEAARAPGAMPTSAWARGKPAAPDMLTPAPARDKPAPPDMPTPTWAWHPDDAGGTAITVQKAGDTVRVDGGQISLTIRQGSPALIESLRITGGPELGPVHGVLNQQMLGYVYAHQTIVHELTVEEEGPVRASILLRGTLEDGQGHTFGRFTARLWAWAGSPLISLTFRVFQDTAQPVAIVYELLLETQTSNLRDVKAAFTKAWHGPLAPRRLEELELRQEKAHEYTIIGRLELERGEHAPGWIAAQGTTAEGATAGLATGVRWFWQQQPKTLTLSRDKLTVGLFSKRREIEWTIDAGPACLLTRGEAKRHHLWLMPYAGEISTDMFQQIQTAWDARPHLLNRDWFAASKVLGNIAPFPSEHFPEIADWLKALDASESSKEAYGIRDWRETMWCHNYRGRAANALLLYFASGRPEWQDYFEQVMHHNLDVDTIHFEPDHPDWVGALRGFGPFHTLNIPAWHVGSNCQDQFLHYYFAGEPDSLEEAHAAARWITRQSGNQDRSARYEGWPLAQMTIAYSWTGDQTYLKSAQEFLRYARLYTHPRRGAYDEVHGSFSHRGIVPFMMGYLGYGLVRYHQATGDPEVAKLLMALAEASVDEASDGKGGYHYSPDPRLSAPGGFGAGLNIGGMLGYSYRLTGDPWFARQALLCYDRGKDPARAAETGLDKTQTMGELLSALALARERGDLE